MNNSVLITGASGGIGEEMCRQFAKAGYDVAIHYNSSESKALSLKAELEERYNVKAVPIKADLRNSNEVSLSSNRSQYFRQDRCTYQQCRRSLFQSFSACR